MNNHYTTAMLALEAELQVQGTEELVCMSCNNWFIGESPIMCCSGHMCGCMGMPSEPIICGSKCYDNFCNREK